MNNIAMDFKKLFEALPGNFLVLAPDEKFTILATTNERDRTTLRKREEIIGMPLFEAFPDNPDDPEASGTKNLKASLNKVLQTKRLHSMPIQKYDIQSSEKGKFEVRYWSPRNVPVLDDAGHVLYIVHQVEDVTPLVQSRKVTSEQLEFNKRLREEVEERTQAQEALRESDERLRSILINSMDGIILTDSDGKISMINQAATDMLGYSQDELRNSNIAALIDKNDYRYKEAVHSKKHQGKFRGELIMIGKRGNRIDVEVTFAVFKDEQNKYWNAIFVRDITSRKEAEKMQERLSTILESTNDYVWIADADGRMLYINQAAKHIMGLENPGTDTYVSNIFPDETVEKILTTALPFALEHGSWSGESMILTRDQGYIPVSQVLLAHKDEYGVLSYFSTIMRDIRKSKSVEDNQRFLAEASKLLNILEYEKVMQDLVKEVVSRFADFCYIDLIEGSEVRRIAIASTKSLPDTGIDRVKSYSINDKKPVGMIKVLQTGKSELVPQVTDAWLRAMSLSSEHFRSLKAMKLHSIMIVPLLLRSKTIGVMFFGSNNVRKSYNYEDLVVAEELGIRVSMAVENASLYKEAQQATLARDEVLRIVAHDLRNPISAIRLTTEILLKTLPENLVNERKKQEMILKSADRANRLIQDLLDVARIEVGQLSIEKSKCSISDLIHEISEFHRPFAEEKKIHFSLDVARNLPEVKLDRSRMFQVFSNLLGNALKFTPSGGSVLLHVELIHDAIKFCVEDTGSGIPEDQLDRIFESFWQAQKGTREGAGLELPITKGIVEAHGGKIWAESKINQGTKIIITIPVFDTVHIEDGRNENYVH